MYKHNNNKNEAVNEESRNINTQRDGETHNEHQYNLQRGKHFFVQFAPKLNIQHGYVE